MHRKARFALAALIAVAPVELRAFTGPQTRGPILAVDPSLEARTVVAPSTIPNAGLGLFARVRISAGEVIGDFGGQLVNGPDIAVPSAYMIRLAVCAFMKIPPFMYIDGRENGGHVSRANFAPRRINGRETGFQNAEFSRLCDAPFVQLVATADIEPGKEIWVSYGPNYHYEAFMPLPAVRDFFCGLSGLECQKDYSWEP